MHCIVCEKSIKKSLSIDTLLKKEYHHICDRCYQQYPLYFEFHQKPIERFMMTFVVLCKRRYAVSYMAYMSYYKPFVIDYIKHHRADIILIFDELTPEVFEILDILKLGSIYAITLYVSIDEKEKEHNDEI